MTRSLTTLMLALLSASCADDAPSGQAAPETTSNSSTDSTAGGTEGTTSTSSSGSNATSTAASSSSNGITSTSTTATSTSGSAGSTSASSATGSGGSTTTSGGGSSSSGGAASVSSTGGSGGGTSGSSTGGGSGVVKPSVLVFSRTTGYRHESIEAGVQALTSLAEQRGWALSATEDPTAFSDTGLSSYNVVVFLNTTDEVLDDNQQLAMQSFIRAGNGYVGVHAGSDTEFDWPWYGELVGAYFKAHPAIQQATIVVEDTAHPATAHLSGTWTRTDEWYGFETNPRDNVHVLLSLDERSYSPGEGSMGGDHPIAWYHEYDGGRSFYTALGHTNESYAEADFLQHLAGGIEWASGAVP